MNIKNITFYLGLGTLATHELDAMTNHEWRVLPLTSWLPDETGITVFLLFHIPLFAIVIALVASKNDIIRNRSKMVISVVLLVHGILHFLFTGTESYEFTSASSLILIYGGAVLGVFYILLKYLENRATNST